MATLHRADSNHSSTSESLAKECFECCVEDRKRYGQAALHVCKEGLAQMEELKGFIEEDAEQFTKLKIVYTKPQIYMGMAMCSQPALKLQDDSGADESEVGAPSAAAVAACEPFPHPCSDPGLPSR